MGLPERPTVDIQRRSIACRLKRDSQGSSSHRDFRHHTRIFRELSAADCDARNRDHGFRIVD